MCGNCRRHVVQQETRQRWSSRLCNGMALRWIWGGGAVGVQGCHRLDYM